MSASTLSDINQMYIELVADLLRKAPEILKTCVIKFDMVPALDKVNYPISIHPVIVASVNTDASVRCMRIAHQCHIAIMNATKAAKEKTNDQSADE